MQQNQSKVSQNSTKILQQSFEDNRTNTFQRLGIHLFQSSGGDVERSVNVPSQMGLQKRKPEVPGQDTAFVDHVHVVAGRGGRGGGGGGE
jgi:hypothetical protein